MKTMIALTCLIFAAVQLRASDAHWAKVSVVLPTSATSFPTGNGSEIANSQCMICHSAGMALRQPALSESEWRTIINKMRTAYGAPVPVDQVDALAAYLATTISERGASDSPHPEK